MVVPKSGEKILSGCAVHNANRSLCHLFDSERCGCWIFCVVLCAFSLLQLDIRSQHPTMETEGTSLGEDASNTSTNNSSQTSNDQGSAVLAAAASQGDEFDELIREQVSYASKIDGMTKCHASPCYTYFVHVQFSYHFCFLIGHHHNRIASYPLPTSGAS